MAKLGGVDPSQIAEIAKEAPSYEAGASASERFVRTVTALVERRHEAGEAAGFSVFLRSQAVNDDVKDRETVPLPFVCNGNDPISQRVVIADTLLGRAYTLSITADPHVFEALEAHGLGKHPALVVDWRGDSPKAMFWPRGVAGGDPVELYLADHEITPEEMKAILDDFYTARLRTPQTITEGHGQRVWEDSSRGWPADRPEEQIQGILIAFLRGRLRHDIRPELPNAEGRLDVQISARLHDGNGARIVKKIWILELKALTDKTATGGDVPAGTVLSGLRKGVNQAYSYREAEHANRAALCCFDMRKDDLGDGAVFGPILKEANDNSVHLWRWFLFRSSHTARVAAAKTKAHA
jgi:hypothetical protein